MIPVWVSQQAPVAVARLADQLGLVSLMQPRDKLELQRMVSGVMSLEELGNLTRELRERLSASQNQRDLLFEELTRERLRYHAIRQSRSMRLGMAATAPVRNWRRTGSVRGMADASINSGDLTQETRAVQTLKFPPVDVQIDVPPASPVAGTKVALIAAWDSRGQISAATAHLAKGFSDFGYSPILVASKGHDPDWIEANRSWLRENFHAVLSAEHDDRDFRSWLIAFEALEGLSDASELILANDSVIGALFDPSEWLAALTNPTCDVRGALESHGPVPHLQSWMLWFGPKVMAEGALLRYLARYGPGLTKRELIETMEIPLAYWFGLQGYEVDAVISALTTATGSSNPATERWQRLIELGMPYVKRELLHNPELATRFPREHLTRTVQQFADEVDVDYLINESLRQLGR